MTDQTGEQKRDRFVTLRSRRRPWYSRAWIAGWGSLRGLAIVISAVASAFAANSAREAVCRVGLAEQQRLDYEPKKFTHDLYRDYIRFREGEQQAVKRPRLACFNFLLGKAFDNDELYELLVSPGEFKYVEERHGQIKVFCHDDGEKAQGWSPTQVLERVSDKVSRDIDVLDAALIGYRHAVGNALLICENFTGFLLAGLERRYKYGALGQFLEKTIEARLIREDNYPNLWQFTRDTAELTGHFTNNIDCKRLEVLFEQRLKASVSKVGEPAAGCDWRAWVRETYQGWFG